MGWIVSDLMGLVGRVSTGLCNPLPAGSTAARISWEPPANLVAGVIGYVMAEE